MHVFSPVNRIIIITRGAFASFPIGRVPLGIWEYPHCLGSRVRTIYKNMETRSKSRWVYQGTLRATAESDNLWDSGGRPLNSYLLKRKEKVTNFRVSFSQRALTV